VQLRQEGALTFEGYVTGQGWTTARLSSCPTCEGPVRSHGTYPRQRPRPAKVARFYCAPCGLTISLLPDFYASRSPGLLKDIEDAAAVAEGAASVEEAAEQARPAEEEEAVTLTAAVRWVRRRIAWARSLLATAIGLFPERFEGCAPTVTSFRQRLGTTQVLVKLRGICARFLGVLAAPLGLVPPPARREHRRRGLQQSAGPDPPPSSP
jgi:hypothetical protein